MTKNLSPPPVITGQLLPLIVALRGPDLPVLTVPRLTHACVLIQSGYEAILTDPWFSQKPLYHHGESLPFVTIKGSKQAQAAREAGFTAVREV